MEQKSSEKKREQIHKMLKSEINKVATWQERQQRRTQTFPSTNNSLSKMSKNTNEHNKSGKKHSLRMADSHQAY